MPARIQRERTKGWTLASATTNPNGAVIVDRTSRYGNPFTIAMAQELGYEEPRKAAIGAFEEWLRGNPDIWQSDEGDRKRERILAGLHRLRGKDIACTCREGDACHGDVYLDWLSQPETELADRIARIRRRVDRQRVSRGLEPLAGGERP